jgi:hypothetical protein
MILFFDTCQTFGAERTGPKSVGEDHYLSTCQCISSEFCQEIEILARARECSSRASWSIMHSSMLPCLAEDNITFGWVVADGWCWFVLREEYCWLVLAGCWWLICSERKVLVAEMR